MKTFNLKIQILITSILFVNSISAQDFIGPVTSDYNLGVSVVTRFVSNDVLEYQGDIYRISGWDVTGNMTAFAWEYNGNQGQEYLTNLPTTIGMDVALIEDAGDIYAVVAYYDMINSDWIVEIFYWDPIMTGFYNYFGPYVFDSGNFGSTIHIDTNNNNWTGGDYAIVWDNDLNEIYCGIGNFASGGPIYYNVLVAYGQYPDLSFYYDGANKIIHISYVDLGGDLVVDDHNVNDILMNLSTPNSVLSVSPTYQFSFPRIASPNGNNSSPGDWTVVVEDSDNSSTYLIVGYNNGNTNAIVYNDMSISIVDLKDTPNYYTSVTYDNNYPSDGIWVGWTWDNTYNIYSPGYYNGMVDDASYPIVIKCDNTGIPANGVSQEYWQVPNNLSPNDYYSFMALSGRFGNDELFSTYHYTTNGDIFCKPIPSISGAGSMKYASQNEISFATNEIVIIDIYDTFGRRVNNFQSLYSDFQVKLYQKIEGANLNFYIVRITDLDQKKTKSFKLMR